MRRIAVVRVTVNIERIWKQVRERAAANGHKYEPSYGIVGVAPT